MRHVHVVYSPCEGHEKGYEEGEQYLTHLNPEDGSVLTLQSYLMLREQEAAQ
jgi:hypothetical protein